MEIVFFAHPGFSGSQSMPRFVNMLSQGMLQRGNNVRVFRPKAVLSRLPAPRRIKKWLGYFDQYILFPASIKKELKTCDPRTLFVFTDQALGPWVHLVSNQPYVIHCHDFLAQQAAKGRIPGNQTGWSGRQYQRLIFNGYSQGKHFISVSRKTKEDLHSFLTVPPLDSEVIYNGINGQFKYRDPLAARTIFGKEIGRRLSGGYILHVGGNQWYKNRIGVIEIYNAWRLNQYKVLPLIMVGKAPDQKLRRSYERSPYKTDIHLIVNLSDTLMPFAYSGASVFLFPSLAEGFGWPIAEAMACGCPVVTTNSAPMTEVAGSAGFLIPIRPNGKGIASWADQSARILNDVLQLTQEERRSAIEAGLLNARRFDCESALNQIEKVYKKVLVYQKTSAGTKECSTMES